MKFIYFLLLCSFFACRERSPINSIEKNRFEFSLIDSLGSISLVIPERTDTFFSWIQRNDCGKPCEHGDYRFQSKQNRIFKESGFFWIGEPEDSVDQLTIYHHRPDTLLKHNDSLIIRYKDRLKSNVLENPETRNVLSDTMMQINGRYFYILKTADFHQKNLVRERRLIAYTTVSGMLLEFHYKLLTKKYDPIIINFFDRSMNNLATVHIQDGG